MDAVQLDILNHKLQERKVNKIDVFDIDGTLFKGRLLLNLIYALCSKLPERRYLLPLLQDRYEFWRYGAISTHDLFEIAVKMADEGFFEGLDRREVEPIAVEVALNCRRVVYPFTSTLLKLMSEREAQHQGLVVAITGAPIEVAKVFCAGYGFDVVLSVFYDVDRNQRYTAKRDLDAGIYKGKVLEFISVASGIRYQDSIGIGDSEADIGIFERVGYPIGINPTSGLLKYIRSNRRIGFVSDSEKKGVQMFRATQEGGFEEVVVNAILPTHLAEKFPRMPGMRY